MAVIEKTIELEGSKGKKEVKALFDSGSTYSCISPLLAKKLEILIPLPMPKQFGTAENGRKIIAKQRAILDFHIDGLCLSDEFMVIEDLSRDVIIGAKTMQAWKIKLDFENDEVITDPGVANLYLI
jgi:hypothetical protein